jgi:acetylornithine deacetylase/succinyl-diaminopimelate desuccinylase-like protein
LKRVERAVVEEVDRLAPSAIELLRELVRTPSRSLDEGLARDASTMAGKVFAAAGRHGTHVVAQPVGPRSENVIEELGPRGGHAFVIEAHMDAVPEGEINRWHDGNPYSGAEGWVEYSGNDQVVVEVDGAKYDAPIRPRMSKIWELYRRDRRRRIVYGRGSFDNKGCVVSALLAMEVLAAACRSSGARLRGPVIAAYTADEEETVRGIKRFACEPDSWLAAEGFLAGPRDEHGMLTTISGVALDGSYGWVPVIGHRGAVQLAITTHGRAAHAATPELGVNAVEAMARIVLALADGAGEIAATLNDVLEPALLGPVTMAVGSTIVGGGVRHVHTSAERTVERAGVNAVPDWCEATVDVRWPQGRRYPNDTEEAKARVIAAVRDHLERRIRPAGWTYDLRELVWGPPVAMARSLEEAASLPMIREERACAAEILGFEPELETAPGGTDATFMIHEARIPTIVELGPAGGLSHDVHEFVEVDSVIEGAKILALLALSRVGVEE